MEGLVGKKMYEGEKEVREGDEGERTKIII